MQTRGVIVRLQVAFNLVNCSLIVMRGGRVAVRHLGVRALELASKKETPLASGPPKFEPRGARLGSLRRCKKTARPGISCVDTVLGVFRGGSGCLQPVLVPCSRAAAAMPSEKQQCKVKGTEHMPQAWWARTAGMVSNSFARLFHCDLASPRRGPRKKRNQRVLSPRESSRP